MDTTTDDAASGPSDELDALCVFAIKERLKQLNKPGSGDRGALLRRLRAAVAEARQTQLQLTDVGVSAPPLDEAAAKRQKTAAAPRPPPFRFMAEPCKWTYVELNDAAYVPQFRTVLEPAPHVLAQPRLLEPAAPGRDGPGHTLALMAGCGRGKSKMFREYMKALLEEDPRARVLLLSANILYGNNLAHELEACGFDLGYYRDCGGAAKGVELATHPVVVCSLESLHHLDGQCFDLVLIDEVRHIQGLVGGATMGFNFGNLHLLRQLWRTTPRRVICDADLLYKVSDTEPCSAVQSLMAFLERAPTLCVSLTHPGPPHLARKARLFYTYKKAARSEKHWLNEIAHAAQAWKDTRHSAAPHRFAVCVGSKKQRHKVCLLLKQLGVPFKPYDGETRLDSKDALRDPDTAWLPLGAIVFTTTLSIGVDPQTISFARVFVRTCHTGCSPIAQCQAALRFGRQAAVPLLNTTIDILLDTKPPAVKAKLAELAKLAETQKRPSTELPTYESVLKRCTAKHAARCRVQTRGYEMSGGPVEGVAAAEPVSDQLLKLLAHHELERALKVRDIHGQVVRVCEHHGWTMDDSDAVSAPPAGTADASTLVPLDLDPDDEFVSCNDLLQKLTALTEEVRQRGTDDFFADCYGMQVRGVAGDGQAPGVAANLGREQLLVRMYWWLKSVQRLVEPAELEKMAKPGVLSGLELNALSRCLTAEQQAERDLGRSLDPERTTPHPYLKLGRGDRMRAARLCAELLGVRSLFEDCELPKRVVDAVNREKRRADQPTRVDADADVGDAAFITGVRDAADGLDVSCRGNTFKTVLSNVAEACGMELRQKDSKPQVDNVRATKAVVERLWLMRRLPTIIDDWLVWSDRLGELVRVAAWHERHSALDEEEQARAMDRELLRYSLDDEAEQGEEEEVAAATAAATAATATAAAAAAAATTSTDTQSSFAELAIGVPYCPRGARLQKLDGLALADELARLRALSRRSDSDRHWLAWLERADQVAEPRPAAPGAPPPPVRYLVVTNAKRRSMGRRIESHPSMQRCPLGLRPLLAMYFYHDIDIRACHPTLMLQVALEMGVPRDELDLLFRYVRSDGERDAIHEAIAAHHGVSPKACKFAVLRMLNNGHWLAWVRDARCPYNDDEPHEHLLEFARIGELVTAAFLRDPRFQSRLVALRHELRVSARARVGRAEARLAAARTDEERRLAREGLNRARTKARPSSIERSVFSLCLFELEDSVLATVVAHFEELGHTVASLIFDGLLVEPGGPGLMGLAAAMAGAERRVLDEHGYRITLVEKPFAFTGLTHGAHAVEGAEHERVQGAVQEAAQEEGLRGEGEGDDDDDDDDDDW